MRDKVQAALDRIRPNLQADGGDVELVDVKDGIVRVKLTGACGGWAMATVTLRDGVARIVKDQVPEIKEVISV